jgi:hypothetical protein
MAALPARFCPVAPLILRLTCVFRLLTVVALQIFQEEEEAAAAEAAAGMAACSTSGTSKAASPSS